MNVESLSMLDGKDVDIQYIKELKRSRRKAYGGSPSEIAVTDLIKYMDENVLMRFMKYLSYKEIRESGIKINLLSKTISDDNTAESVSDINGIAIPLYHEYLSSGNSTILSDKMFINFLEKHGKDNKLTNIKKLLELSNMYIYYTSGYNYKVNQIKEYNWMTNKDIRSCLVRINKVVGSDKELKYETKVNRGIIYGSIDIIDHKNKIVYEIKTVGMLSTEHLVQLSLYMYLYDKSDYRYILYNIITDRAYEIKYDKRGIIDAVEFLMYEKYSDRKISDKQFIINNMKIMNKYYDNNN
jgi:hypothetical protein